MNDNIIKEYLDGVGVIELANKYAVHRSTIQRILKKKNIPLRKKSPQFKYNVNFFDTYSPESCYWAGFISADGCIRSDRDTLSIKLALVDIEHLNKFKDSINYTGFVKTHNTYCYIDISGKWFSNQLDSKFNITSRKSFIVTVPNIPTDMVHHFIRGYFDGDGCITKTSTDTISFTSGSVEFLEQISQMFYDLGVRIKSKNIFPPIQNEKQISYSGKNAITILNWMYTGCSELTILDRKYEKYLNIIK